MHARTHIHTHISIDYLSFSSQERIGTLLEAIKTSDESMAHHFKKSEEWATVEEMMAAHGSKCNFLSCFKKNTANFGKYLIHNHLSYY